MGPILALLVIGCVSLLLVRAGAVALTMTGLDRQTAIFQALSAFFGVGFTTSEAEMVVRHPIRRRVIQHLIIAGNIGLTSALGTVIVTFVREDASLDSHPIVRVGLIALIVFSIAALARVGPLMRPIDLLARLTLRSAGYVRPTDYEVLLRTHKGYGVAEITVEPGHWAIGRSLRQANLTRWGVMIVGILRSDGDYVAAPSSRTEVLERDELIAYGRTDMIAQLSDLAEPVDDVGPDATGADAGTRVDR
ncbi:MAG: TrkA C-terminal domain-containing protein [Planctomycetota bacterium]